MNIHGRLLAGPVVAALAGLAVTVAMIGGARADSDDCATPPDMLEANAKLPHLAERLKARQPVTVVAIGGASTIGQAAGSPDLSYPHRLERDRARGQQPREERSARGRRAPLAEAYLHRRAVL